MEWNATEPLTKLGHIKSNLSERSTMKFWASFALTILITCSLQAADLPESRKPNVVFILADDK